MAYNENYFMVTCNGFDPEDDKYNAGLLNIHSDTLIHSKNAYGLKRRLYSERKISCVEWGPLHYIKITFQKNPLHILPNEKLASNKLSVVQLGNTAGIRHYFNDKICKKFDKMYTQKTISSQNLHYVFE